jgi:hypothetical protein
VLRGVVTRTSNAGPGQVGYAPVSYHFDVGPTAQDEVATPT